MISFDNIPEQRIERFKGGSGCTLARMFSDERVKIMRGVLKSGCSIGMHTHETSSEIIAEVCPRITAISFTAVPDSKSVVARLCLSE